MEFARVAGTWKFVGVFVAGAAIVVGEYGIMAASAAALIYSGLSKVSVIGIASHFVNSKGHAATTQWQSQQLIKMHIQILCMNEKIIV